MTPPDTNAIVAKLADENTLCLHDMGNNEQRTKLARRAAKARWNKHQQK